MRRASAREAGRSQKTSQNRASGAHAGSIGPQTRRTYARADRENPVPGPCELQETWEPRDRNLGIDGPTATSSPPRRRRGHSQTSPRWSSFRDRACGRRPLRATPRPPHGFGRRPGRSHRRDGSRPRSQHLLVGGARETGSELVGTVSGEHQMSVGVDEAGEHRPPVTSSSDCAVKPRDRSSGPTHTTGRRVTTARSRCTIPRSPGASRTLVTSDPMLRTTSEHSQLAPSG